MATVSTATAGPAAARDPEGSGLGAIGALKAGPVRRNLFGPVDHNQLRQDFERLLRMSVEVANKRWNFDFRNERPGRGCGVEWEELRCQDVPAFYRSCMVRQAPAGGHHRVLQGEEEEASALQRILPAVDQLVHSGW
ncbi:unnamed protein product [Tetraodon nigroviridis]|uniref:(spotted green pufferfish) hypothetical protein n=1 Tax=Tetraodon nigroviridis TaxID=99883 RepID=Q4RHJ2_TETNG|nr:unnamed protein product [Tetraodon nigroviridis]